MELPCINCSPGNYWADCENFKRCKDENFQCPLQGMNEKEIAEAYGLYEIKMREMDIEQAMWKSHLEECDGCKQCSGKHSENR